MPRRLRTRRLRQTPRTLRQSKHNRRPLPIRKNRTHRHATQPQRPEVRTRPMQTMPRCKNRQNKTSRLQHQTINRNTVHHDKKQPATHHQTRRTSPDTGRRAHNPRHLPELPQHAHRHARSRISHMPRLPRGMGCASNQSSPRRKTMASANHRHTQRRGQGAETIRPDRITQPHQPMAQTRQTPRHADRTQAAVHVQPRRVGRTT